MYEPDNEDEFDFQQHLRLGIPFSGQDFANLRIEDLDGREHDLSGIELRTSTFCRCDFSGAVFDDGDFESCVFSDCNFRKAKFNNIAASGLSFMECQLDGATFNFADLDGIILHECFGRVSMNEACVTDSTFTKCAFEGSDFRGADLSGAMFYEGSIARALMNKKTWLTKTGFRGTDITDVCLTTAYCCNDVDLTEAIVFPFITITGERSVIPMERRLPGPKEALDGRPVNLNIYQVDLAAKLYCADIGEFRRAR